MYVFQKPANGGDYGTFYNIGKVVKPRDKKQGTCTNVAGDLILFSIDCKYLGDLNWWLRKLLYEEDQMSQL